METLVFIGIGAAIGAVATTLIFRSKIKNKYFTVTATSSEELMKKQIKHKLSKDFPVEILSRKEYPTSTTFQLKYIK